MTAVHSIFAAAGLDPQGCVPWGSAVPLSTSGLYLVSTVADADATSSATSFSMNPDAARTLLMRRPELAIDGTRATESSLMSRLAAMWVPGEPTLYIGLAGTSMKSRVGQYYSTPLGARSPHAGGWPIKMLSCLRQLWVYFAASDEPDAAERAMVDAFARGIPSQLAAKLHDPTAPIPYANLMFPAGRKKRHGITGAKASRT